MSLSSLKDHHSLLDLLDVTRQQKIAYLQSLIVSWAKFEVEEYEKDNTAACPREPDVLKTISVIQGVTAYYESLNNLLVALERAYRDYKETPEAWDLVKAIIAQLLADRSACARAAVPARVLLHREPRNL